jgi:hypothetical protein
VVETQRRRNAAPGLSRQPRASLLAELDCPPGLSGNIPREQVEGLVSLTLDELPAWRCRGVQHFRAHWYDGWNNSFNKGYEQFSVGPATSWFGIFIFAVAMVYVPMAQARQAITGEWRSFYQWGLVWRLVRLRWLQSLGIAAVYALVSFPILILRAGAPYIQGKAQKLSAEQLMALPYDQVVQSLNQYYLWCALLILPAFVLVRWLAARNYAAGIALAIKRGLIAAFGLSDFERGALARLNMLEPAPAPPRHILLRMVARIWRFGLRSAAITAIFLVWVIYIFELYVAQFFHYIPGVGWLNHCLVQLPWFHFIPDKF